MKRFFESAESREADVVFSEEQVAEETFKFFRKNGFPYPNIPKHICMQEINRLRGMKDSELLRAVIKPIADTYHKHRFKASTGGKRSPVESFAKDESLKHAIKLSLMNGGRIGDGYFGPLSLTRGTQACSNFRSAFALYVYRKYGIPGGVVLDTSTGYGGRLVGFLASDCERYIGFDPNKPTYNANLKIASELGQHKTVELCNLPIEDANPKELGVLCDVAFTSPPYFTKEHYSEDDTQSWVRYPTFKRWCKGFLLPMIQFQFDCLKPGAVSLVNIDNVKIKGESYPLVLRTIQAAKRVGFVHEGSFGYPMSKRSMGTKGAKGEKFQDAGEDQKDEPVLIFRKPK